MELSLHVGRLYLNIQVYPMGAQGTLTVPQGGRRREPEWNMTTEER